MQYFATILLSLIAFDSSSTLTINEAKSEILACHRSYSQEFEPALEYDHELRKRFVSAHLALSRLSVSLPEKSNKRKQLFNLCRDLTSGTCSLTTKHIYTRDRVYDPKKTPTIIFIRERLYRTWADALPDSKRNRTKIADTAGFSDLHRKVFEDYSVLIMDNGCLDDDQLKIIDRLLSLIPAELHDLKAIGVTGEFGEFPKEIGWWDFFDGKGGEVNIFGTPIGASKENPFPSEVESSSAPIFCTCLAHEANHIVDAYAVYNSQGLRSRKQMLIQSAGREHLNYLRSTIPDGYFSDAPQEFFASLSNQWFVDSAKTIHLGILLFKEGNRHPINQALFFAEVYSVVGKVTCFYETDPSGLLTRHDVPVRKNKKGNVTGFGFGGIDYDFKLNSHGDVVNYKIAPLKRRWSQGAENQIEARLIGCDSLFVELKTDHHKSIRIERPLLSDHDRAYLKLFEELSDR